MEDSRGVQMRVQLHAKGLNGDPNGACTLLLQR